VKQLGVDSTKDGSRDELVRGLALDERAEYVELWASLLDEEEKREKVLLIDCTMNREEGEGADSGVLMVY
jgi:hypothetical protein